jgi:carbamoyltransferase
MLRMARTAHRETGLRNLCLAGGVALNCVANGRVLRESPFERIWIQPAAGDAGGAVGVAQLIWHRYCQQPRDRADSPVPPSTIDVSDSEQFGQGAMSLTGGATAVAVRPVQQRSSRMRPAHQPDGMHGAYLGPSSTPTEIAAFMNATGAVGERLERTALLDRVADLLARGKVIGWMNGRMEFGPRALGSRSILGDPRNPRMQAQMNLKVKFRESFRPFAPSVLRERVGEYFELDQDSPYMLLVADVRSERQVPMSSDQRALWGIDKLNVVRSDIPAVTHIDYSARVQTVDRATNADYYDLLKAFESLTGCGVLINTSFNVRGEPIVCTPADAYRCFMRTDIDYLVLWPYLLAKDAQPDWKENGDWRKEFQLD